MSSILFGAAAVMKKSVFVTHVTTAGSTFLTETGGGGLHGIEVGRRYGGNP